MRNLTVDEARARAAAVAVDSYDVELDLTRGAEHLGSRTTVRFRATEDTFLELDCVKLVHASLDGRPLALDGNRLPLTGLGGEHEVVVEAVCAYTRTGEGLHRFVDPADDAVYVYANAFLDDAQRFFACFDQPDLKASFRLSVRAPEGHVVRSNSRGELVDGVHVFAQTARLSTYLLTLAAGPWHGEHALARRHRAGRLVPRVHGRLTWRPTSCSSITAQCFDQQQQAFGSRYPFGDTYDQVFVPEFNAGAMENPGMVTFNDETFLFRSRTTEGNRRLRAQVIAHEMAHMWFGDLVTMRWWDGVWLNESFAEFMGLHTIEATTRFHGAWADFCLGRKAWGYRADQLPTTHPVDAVVERQPRRPCSTSTASPTPRARRCCGSWSPSSAKRPSSRGCATTCPSTPTATPTSLTCWPRWSAAAARSWASGRGCGSRPPAWRRCARSGGTASLVVVQDGDPLRPHVVEVGCYDRRRQRCPRAPRAASPVEVTGAETAVAGRRARRPRAGQRRRPHLRQGPLRRPLAATVLARLGELARPAGTRPLLGRALGRLPRRRAAGATTTSGGARRRGRRGRPVAGGDAAAARRSARGARLRRPDRTLLARTGQCWDAAVEPGSDLQLVRVRAAVSRRRRRRPAAGRARRHRGPRRADRRRRAPLARGPAPRRARSSSARPRSPPSSLATGPPAVSCRRRLPWRRSPTRGSRQRSWDALVGGTVDERAGAHDGRRLLAARPARRCSCPTSSATPRRSRASGGRARLAGPAADPVPVPARSSCGRTWRTGWLPCWRPTCTRVRAACCWSSSTTCAAR